ncbi:MAG: prepilin-type N-terminal cleavage/methylation domain-containing protein [Candidatus Zixiibacteriota bacterium]
MKRQYKAIQNCSGLSMIEILIALLISGIVIAAVFQVYIAQHKNWKIQGDITEVQQNARAAIDELTRQVRMAGHALPLGLKCVEAYNTNPDTIVVNYSADGCNAPIIKKMPQPSSELDCSGYDVSCFYEGQFAYIFHPDSGGGEFFEISHVQEIPGKIQHNKWILTKCYDEDAIIVALDRIKFYIDRTDTLHPNLMIQVSANPPQVYAENVTDLQFRYRMKNGIVVDVPPIAEDIREVLIDLSARTSEPDSDFAENPYRTRSYSSRVNLRNLDI